MLRCKGCYYNLVEGEDNKHIDFAKYGCGQPLCIKEMQMFDLDPNEKILVNENKNNGGNNNVYNEVWAHRERKNFGQ